MANGDQTDEAAKEHNSFGIVELAEASITRQRRQASDQAHEVAKENDSIAEASLSRRQKRQAPALGVCAFLGLARPDKMRERILPGPVQLGIPRQIVSGIEIRRRVSAFERAVSDVVANWVHAGRAHVGIGGQIPGLVEETRFSDNSLVGTGLDAGKPGKPGNQVNYAEFPAHSSDSNARPMRCLGF